MYNTDWPNSRCHDCICCWSGVVKHDGIKACKNARERYVVGTLHVSDAACLLDLLCVESKAMVRYIRARRGWMLVTL